MRWENTVKQTFFWKPFVLMNWKKTHRLPQQSPRSVSSQVKGRPVPTVVQRSFSGVVRSDQRLMWWNGNVFASAESGCPATKKSSIRGLIISRCGPYRHTYIPRSITHQRTEDMSKLQCFLPPMAWAQRKMRFKDTGRIHFTLCSHRDKTAFNLLYRQSVFYLLIKKERNMLKYVLIKCLIGFCTFLLWAFVVFSSLCISWRTDGLFLYGFCARNPVVDRWRVPAYQSLQFDVKTLVRPIHSCVFQHLVILALFKHPDWKVSLKANSFSN